jgi:hypothetical protein
MEPQLRLEETLRYYFGKEMKLDTNTSLSIDVKLIPESNLIVVNIPDEKETITRKLNYRETIEKVLFWFLDIGGADQARGIHPVLTVGKDDIAYHTGLWIASQISDEQMPYIAYKLNDGAFGETFEIAIKLFIEDQFESLYTAPQAQLEREIRRIFEKHNSQLHYEIPDATWLEVLEQGSLEAIEESIQSLLKKLPEHEAYQKEIDKFQKELAFERFKEQIQALSQAKPQYNLSLNDPIIHRNFEAGQSIEEAFEAAVARFQYEEQLRNEVQIYTEIWARQGQNILVLKNYPSYLVSKVIKDASINADSAEKCFEDILIAASEYGKDLAQIDTELIVYIARVHEIPAIQEGTRMLSTLACHKYNEIPPHYAEILCVINFKGQILDILADTDQHFSASKQELNHLSFISENPQLGEILDKLEQEQEIILSIDEWLTKYQIESNDDGETLEVDMSDREQILALQEANLLWTEYDSGIIQNNLGFVNRCRYLKGKIPAPNFQETAITVINPKPIWENIHFKELETQIEYAGRQLPRNKDMLFETIRRALESAFTFIQDEYEIAEGDDLSFWTDRLEELFKAQAALKRLSQKEQLTKLLPK